MDPVWQAEDVSVEKQVLFTLKLEDELIAQVDIQEGAVGQFPKKLILLPRNIVDLGAAAGEVQYLFKYRIGFLCQDRIMGSTPVNEVAIEYQDIRCDTFHVLDEFVRLASRMPQVYI